MDLSLESLSPAVRSAVVAYIVKYEVYRHRRLEQRICTEAKSLAEHLGDRKRSRTTWEVIHYLCQCHLRSLKPTTTDIFISASLSKGTAINCINRLTEHGLAEKVSDTQDKRQRRITLAPPYTDFLDQFVIECFEEFRDLIAPGLAENPTAHNVALRERLERAELLNRSKTAFIAHLSHDLRVPLNTIIGLSHIMDAETIGKLEPPGYRQYAHDIHHAAGHLLELINDIADISRFELSGDLQLELTNVEIVSLTQECIRLVQAQAELAEVTVEFRAPAAPLDFNADELRLKRALLNLLSNAIRYTPKNGHVTVSVNTLASMGIEISVTDNGFGIPQSLLDIVMGPSETGALAEVLLAGGNGIGLTVVRAFVELHGGNLQLDSQLGNGTTARIKLPKIDVPFSC